jgi:hypothetical protein
MDLSLLHPRHLTASRRLIRTVDTQEFHSYTGLEGQSERIDRAATLPLDIKSLKSGPIHDRSVRVNKCSA